MEWLGWIGGVLMALCALPEAYLAITTRQSALSWPFLLMWFFGELLLLSYTLLKSKHIKLLPLIFNYGLNILFLLVIFSIKLS